MYVKLRTGFQKLIHCFHIKLGHVENRFQPRYDLRYSKLASVLLSRIILPVEEDGDIITCRLILSKSPLEECISRVILDLLANNTALVWA